MDLFSVEYQVGSQVNWHTAFADNGEVASDFVSNLYSDIHGNKATVLRWIKLQPQDGRRYGVISHRVIQRIETHKYLRSITMVAWLAGELNPFVMEFSTHREEWVRKEFFQKLHSDGCSESPNSIRVEYYYDAPVPRPGIQHDCFCLVEKNGERRWFDRGGRPASDDCHTFSRVKRGSV